MGRGVRAAAHLSVAHRVGAGDAETALGLTAAAPAHTTRWSVGCARAPPAEAPLCGACGRWRLPHGGSHGPATSSARQRCRLGRRRARRLLCRHQQPSARNEPPACSCGCAGVAGRDAPRMRGSMRRVAYPASQSCGRARSGRRDEQQQRAHPGHARSPRVAAPRRWENLPSFW